ncbi:MAG: flagellar protein export ATPase FliI [Pseudomonadota bacterium]
MDFDVLTRAIEDVPTDRRYGRVSAVQGLLVQICGAQRSLAVGSRLEIEPRTGPLRLCEVVGFKGDDALAMSFSGLDGIGVGCKAHLSTAEPMIAPTNAWLGRVVNALGEPIDGKGPLPQGARRHKVRANPMPAHLRARVGARVDLGVRALNSFVTCCKGQRMGIFAGSGVGKSVLLSMLARYTQSDVAVIGLVGERGREVQEFIEDDLGEEGLARSIVVVATSDESALMRRQAAHMTLALSEFFRSQNQHVLCLMDSVTRFAMAQREIGLAGGEPPTTRGYTPTVFSELPKLLERAGPGANDGAITGLFTVLVEGDDHNEPVADAVRGILDGHIVMERSIAERGRFPAINVLKSVSRTMPDCHSEAEQATVKAARSLLSSYGDMEDMIRLGAYRRGTNPDVDKAIALNPALEAFLSQQKSDQTSLEDGFLLLEGILAG